MGIKQDVEDNLKAFPVTKIDGQRNNKNLNKFKSEFSEMLASFTTMNRGGLRRHVGMITEDAFYCTFFHGRAPFTIPINTGPYPVTVEPDMALCE